KGIALGVAAGLRRSTIWTGREAVQHEQGCHKTCGSNLRVTAALSGLRLPSLIAPSLHYRASLRSTPFVPLRLHYVQSPTDHRPPVYSFAGPGIHFTLCGFIFKFVLYSITFAITDTIY
ncbi:MAG: hypothetical protein R6W78_17545, partial [Bacteroidales bacterium]